MKSDLGLITKLLSIVMITPFLVIIIMCCNQLWSKPLHLAFLIMPRFLAYNLEQYRSIPGMNITCNNHGCNYNHYPKM